MDSTDRAETRQMIIDLLEPYHRDVMYQARLTNVSLNQIDSHLSKLNGSVSKHEKLINDNLPHTVANCAQKDILQRINDRMISKKTIYLIMTLTISAIIAILELFKWFS